jgi:hypothetical protein
VAPQLGRENDSMAAETRMNRVHGLQLSATQTIADRPVRNLLILLFCRTKRFFLHHARLPEN